MRSIGKSIGGSLILTALLAGLILGVPTPGNTETESADKTLSPYFLVKSDDPETDQLPLKSTSAEVSIAGVIADARVTQVYENEGSQPLEAIYVFPASTRAAVHGMKMTIGERTIVAEIREREQARREYEQAKAAGKSASLLEQQRPNVFQMNVANILPGDTIRVELRYTELLVPTDGTYEFVYPTVVGPRYSELPASEAPPSEKWVQNPYLKEGEAPPYDFGFQATISAGLPIAEITVPSHETDVRFTSPTVATVGLTSAERDGGNRDVILKYRLSGGKIETGLLLFQGEPENFFLLMMQPPRRVESASIPPREYVFIVDVSGSMRGFPLDTAKALLRNLIGNLRPTDTFNVLLFAGGSRILGERSVPADQENIGRAIAFIDNQRGGGGTQLLPALRRALGLPAGESVSRSMVVVTDGFVRVETEAFDLIRNNLGEANLFAFGIGSSVNRFLIEGMARVGMGEPFVVTQPGEARKKASKFREYIETPVLTGIQLAFDGFGVRDVEPKALPDLLARRPLIAYGKWRGEPTGTIRLAGAAGGGRAYSAELAVDRFSPNPAHSGLRYLWARKRISLLSDYNQLSPGEARADEITLLGLKYNLLTAYTSFVAVDSRVRTGEEAATVKQPLPLPRGVSDAAVGAPMATGIAAAPGVGMERKMARSITGSRPELVLAEQAPAEKAEEVDEGKPEIPGVRVTIVSDRLTVNGAVDPGEAEKVIRSHLAEIKRCAASLKAQDPTFTGGGATLLLTVGPDGHVTAAVVQGEIAQTPMGQCVTDVTEDWRFPVPADGADVMVTVVLRVTVGS